MRYHTTSDSQPLITTIGSLTLTKLAVDPMDNNVYILNDSAKRAIVIDAANQADRICQITDQLNVGAIITTHRHDDHIQALDWMARRTPSRLICGTPDAMAITMKTHQHQQGVWTGDTVSYGQISLDVVGLVGHTPGAIALILETDGEPVHIFTGDSLFPGGLGKTASRADFDSLFADVKEHIFIYPDSTVIHPGHGDATTLGDERPHLDQWWERGW